MRFCVFHKRCEFLPTSQFNLSNQIIWDFKLYVLYMTVWIEFRKNWYSELPNNCMTYQPKRSSNWNQRKTDKVFSLLFNTLLPQPHPNTIMWNGKNKGNYIKTMGRFNNMPKRQKNTLTTTINALYITMNYLYCMWFCQT